VHGATVGTIAIIAVGGISMAMAQTGTGAPSAKPSAACTKAMKRVASQEKSVANSQAAIERTQKDSTTCTTKPVCDRYAIKIREEQERKAKREARLAKLKAEAAKACATP
ncbi:MAG TPA: hypothetical protein VLU54_15560, partial [Casimicrobiaceae bacterium]|nr:hypothetical protein [Casimicrobiaceae bacterium]